jgi:integrase
MTGKRRRSHGEGSIFTYKDGYAAIFDLGWINGKRTRKWVYGKTEKDTLRKLNELKRRQESGENLAAQPRTLEAWTIEWLAMKAREGTRPSTLRGYRWLISSHIVPALGKLSLDKLNPTAIRRLLVTCTDAGLSASSVRHVHGMIRNILADAEREELIARNPARAVRPPSARVAEREILTVEDAQRLIEAIRGDRLEALWVCALTLGLRRGELLGLRWSDVDFDLATVTVRQTVLRVDGHLQFAEPKTDRSRRTIPVPKPTMLRLRTHRALQAGNRLAAGTRWTDHGLVFASTIGTPLEPRNVDRSWHAVRANLDLDHIRLHDLRHACATFLLASGASPRTVMKTLGHSQISLTMNTYAHVLPEIERTAVDDAARRLFG